MISESRTHTLYVLGDNAEDAEQRAARYLLFGTDRETQPGWDFPIVHVHQDEGSAASHARSADRKVFTVTVTTTTTA